MPKRLGWRKGPGSFDPDWQLRYDAKRIGTVAIWFSFRKREKLGYYWYARSEEFGVPLCNTAASQYPPYATDEEAKVACEAYVRKHFKKPEKPPPVQQG